MTQPIKILAFAGSSRIESYNKKLVKVAVEGARMAGAKVTYIDFLDYPMPLFNEDLEGEKGLPDSVVEFKTLLKTHQGFLIACPEYNGSITPLLKNAIDWATRPAPGEPGLACFKGKIAALMATSPGALGGIRGLVHVRAILEGIGVIVIPQQKAIPNAQQAFDSNGFLTDEKQFSAIHDISKSLVDITCKLNP